ncbi:putative MINDY deubiquitinase [Lyophyllum shimeji]|uniref:MINDY deubiquitinase n=1 Tax=Lyophyllum shimeji TaxID=47721 RepID=A0A9P3UTM0_LYOSH|nr:putative MINDY deubiquitinase [Lyophyllum shimeji]
MLHYAVPSVDEDNPLYCPSVSAASYLQSLRHQLHRTKKSGGKNRRNNRLLQSFARVLQNALLPDAYDSSEAETHGKTVFIPNFNADGRSRTPSTSSEDAPPNYSAYPIPAWELEHERDFWNAVKGNLVGYGGPAHLKRKRGSFSDIQGPPKYARSIQSVHDTSFDVTVKHEKLSYSGGPGTPVETKAVASPRELDFADKDGKSSDLAQRVRDLEDRLYGHPIGTESPRGIHSLIERLDRILPGIRLKERLSQQSRLSHQSIVDFLGNNGYLNARVLSVFRTSEVHWITLTDSLSDANGLNLCADILPTFSQPNSFLFLSELSLRDIAIQDFDMIYIQHLPKLSTLLLDNTAISNEAIFLLVPLKRSLTQLSIGSNPGIDDDAVPALLLLSKLSFLSILDTSIYMPGLRRLARTIYYEDRIIDIEIPSSCEEYVDDMHNKYALDPRPPLVTDPEVCALLSAAALQRNLAAHAAINPGIVAAGGKAEMAERLRALLEMRRMDLLVRDMFRGVEDDGV